jgi:hypothetical protein
LVKIYLAVQASSASLKRVFSQASKIISKNLNFLFEPGKLLFLSNNGIGIMNNNGIGIINNLSE